MGDQRAGEERVLAVDEASQQLGELAVVGQQPLDALGEAAVLGVEVFLEPAFDLLLDRVLVLIECFLQADDEAVALAAEDVGADLPADVPQGEDADLHRFDGVLVAVVAFRVLDEGADDLAVVDHQLQWDADRQFAVGVFGGVAAVDRCREFAQPWRTWGFPFRGVRGAVHTSIWRMVGRVGKHVGRQEFWRAVRESR